MNINRELLRSLGLLVEHENLHRQSNSFFRLPSELLGHIRSSHAVILSPLPLQTPLARYDQNLAISNRERNGLNLLSDSDDSDSDEEIVPQQVFRVVRLMLLLREELGLFFLNGERKPLATAKSIRENLPTGQANEGDKCAVCLDEYELNVEGRKVVKLACDHLFHKECILPWLEQNNSCPTCRHPMESDDPEWNEKNKELLEKAQRNIQKRPAAASTPIEEEQESKRQRT